MDAWNLTSECNGDTVYVTSNHHTSKIAGDSFHRLTECHRDKLDNHIGTVHPEPAVDAALTAIESHPNKRLIVHLIQPPHSFVRRESNTMTDGSGTTGAEKRGTGSDRFTYVTHWRCD